MTRPEKLRHVPEAAMKIGRNGGVVSNAVGINKHLTANNSLVTKHNRDKFIPH